MGCSTVTTQRNQFGAQRGGRLLPQGGKCSSWGCAPSPRAQLREIWHALPHQSGALFGHAQNNGAALGVNHGGIGLPKTAGNVTTRRFGFGVDAFGTGLHGGEKVELAHGVFLLIIWHHATRLFKLALVAPKAIQAAFVPS